MLPRVIIVMRVVVVGVVGGRLTTMIEPMIRDGRGRRGQGAARRGRLLHGSLDLLLDPAGGLLEFANGAGETPGEVGQALSPEEQQHEHENEQQLGATDVSDEGEYRGVHG